MATLQPTQPSQPLAPPDAALVEELLRTRVPRSSHVTGLTALPGDASNRRYYRVECTGGPLTSVILMQLAEPEAFKQSEEAVSGANHHIQELPFTNILSHLAKTGISVPKLYCYDRTVGLLYLEDFGDMKLAEACREASPARLKELYRQAVDSLVLMQVRGSTPPDPNCLAFHRRFDVPLLMWEFDHFLEYGVVARRGKPMCAEDWESIRREMVNIAEMLASQPTVFVHRDYHSRNLMVDGDRLGVIDFQDALLGPATYDLASLLRDAYIQLDEALIDELIDFYHDRRAELTGVQTDRAEFRRLFDLTSIQRNLKAAGRFVYIDRVKRNPKFLPDIPRTLGYVRRNLKKYPELATLKKHLTPYVPELQ